MPERRGSSCRLAGKRAHRDLVHRRRRDPAALRAAAWPGSAGPAELGGLGQIVAGVLVAVGGHRPPAVTVCPGSAGSGSVGLFVVVYLVRVWLYVVRGRLPGPGIL